jgi:hypothetical protein
MYSDCGSNGRVMLFYPVLYPTELSHPWLHYMSSPHWVISGRHIINVDEWYTISMDFTDYVRGSTGYIVGMYMRLNAIRL